MTGVYGTGTCMLEDSPFHRAVQLAPSTGQATDVHSRPAVVWGRRGTRDPALPGVGSRGKAERSWSVTATPSGKCCASDRSAHHGCRGRGGSAGAEDSEWWFGNQDSISAEGGATCTKLRAHLGAIRGHWGRSWCGERRPEEASPGLQGLLEQIKEFSPDTSVKKRSAELRNEAMVPSERWL